jgi:hypothetical protein
LSKGYKLEFIEKVKKKNDLQPNSNKNSGVIAKPPNDKRSQVCKSVRMVRMG